MTRHALTASNLMGAGDPGDDTVVVEDGRVVELTTRDRVGSLPTTVHRNATILPSFSDSHIHPLGYASLVNGTSLKETANISDLQARLGEAAARLPARQAVVAQRLDDGALGRLPTRRDLDQAVEDRPVIAYRYCGHVAVVNTAALELAGITADTVDPAGGVVDRDEAGVPTGVLRETAVDLVAPALEPLVPSPTDAEILSAIEGLVATGLTHLGSMVAAAQPLWCGVGDELGTLCSLGPDLPLDMDVMVIADTPADLKEAARQLEHAGGRLRFWGWKSFADGSLGGQTAYMWEPFADADTTGTSRLDPSHARLMAQTSLDLGGVVAVHAIGDRAIDETLDLFDQLLADGCRPENLRIEHLSVASDEAISRLAATGVIASIQPSFLTSEDCWVPARLGRTRRPYRFAAMRDAGVQMIGGSDCPVERPDPLLGIAAAVHRSGWSDNEHLAPEEAVALYTNNPAGHFGRPDPLAVGSPGDLVVVEGAVGESEAQVVALYVGGEPRELRPVEWPG